MAEETMISSEIFKDVNGGTAAAYSVLKQDIQNMIPDAVKGKLSTAKSDAEACRILSDNGVNLDAIQKKIADAGFGRIKISRQELPEDALVNAAGGFFPINTSTDVVCTCGARDRDDFTIQAFLALTASSRFIYIYRCKKCGQLIGLTRDGKVEYIDTSLPINW